jgi:hypothetical protein
MKRCTCKKTRARRVSGRGRARATRSHGYWYVVKFFDSTHRSRLGSDGSAIFKDLKTESGVSKRLVGYRTPSWARTFTVYRVPAERFYDDRAYQELSSGTL